MVLCICRISAAQTPASSYRYILKPGARHSIDAYLQPALGVMGPCLARFASGLLIGVLVQEAIGAWTAWGGEGSAGACALFPV